ncbi:energy transducer TonB [Algoriphagus namhaensis]
MKSLTSLILFFLALAGSLAAQNLSSSFEKGNEFLRRNLSYPTEARMNNVEGKVVVQLTFDEQGFPSSTKILSGDPLLEQEAQRTMDKMIAQWNPDFFTGTPSRNPYLITLQYKIAHQKDLFPAVYLGASTQNQKPELSPEEFFSSALSDNPYDPELYKQRAVYYQSKGMDLLAQKDELIADYFSDIILSSVVIVGYNSTKKKLGSAE